MTRREPASVPRDEAPHREEANGARRWPAIIAFVLVLIATFAVSLFILQQILAHSAYPYDLDEANHASGALAILLGYNAGGLDGLLRAFMRQGFYPPAFAPLQLLSFAALDVSPTALRVSSLVALSFAVLLIYVLCLRLDNRYGWLAGLVACGATLTSQPLLVNASLVMKETPGLLFSLLYLWLYLRALARPTPRRLALTGASLLLVFLTKYTYGVAVLGTALLLELSLLRWPSPTARGTANAPTVPALLRRSLRERYIWLFGPFLLGITLWFAYPGNLGRFIDYVTAQPQGKYSMSLATLLYYPRSIALSQTPASIFALLTALSLLWALLHWRDTSTRLLLIYFLAGVTMMTFNRPQTARFIATFVPAAHILTGLMVARLARRRSLPRTLPPLASRTAAALVIAIIGLSLPNVAQRFRQYPARVSVAYETDPQLNGLATWVQTQIPPDERFYIINYWDQFGPQTLAWRLGKGALAANLDLRFSDVRMPSALLSPATPRRTERLRQQILRSDVSHILVLEGGPWGAPFWPDYTAALQDHLQHTAETTMTITHPIARGESNQLTIKAIVYRWKNNG